MFLISFKMRRTHVSFLNNAWKMDFNVSAVFNSNIIYKDITGAIKKIEGQRKTVLFFFLTFATFEAQLPHALAI